MFPQVYGAAIQFYESFPRELLSERQSVRLGLLSVVDRRPIAHRSLQVKKSICVLSHWPFFNVFQKFLTFIYRYSISGPHVLPLEKSVQYTDTFFFFFFYLKIMEIQLSFCVFFCFSLQTHLELHAQCPLSFPSASTYPCSGTNAPLVQNTSF